MGKLMFYKFNEEDIIVNDIYKQMEIDSRIEEAEIFAGIKRSIDIALRLEELKVDDKIIMESTGLSLTDINSLKR